jgi:hypothetical protein
LVNELVNEKVKNMDLSNKYNRRILVLSILVGALALIYGGALLFEPDRADTRNAAYTWLDAQWMDQADRIELSGSDGQTTLVRDGEWFVQRGDTRYPARQLRVEDLLRILSTKGTYPVRGSSSYERLGLSLDSASRIIIRGGASEYPLLDLLVGNPDATGREVYLRKNNQDEVRSGDSKLSGYLSGAPSSWFDLRLFPHAEAPDSVQAFKVYVPAAPDAEGKDYRLTRTPEGWASAEAPALKVDSQKVDAYLRSVFSTEGEDFVAAAGEVLNEGSIELELGDGRVLRIVLGPALESERRSVVVSGSPLVYAFSEWALGRLFRDLSYFAADSAE